MRRVAAATPTHTTTPMKLGLISDTHDFFDPKIPGIFQGVDHILHAGDIGRPWVILELEHIAPVTAVLGNNDVATQFQETEIVQLGGRKFLIHHIVSPHAPAAPLQRRLLHETPDAVIFGHTHQPFSETIGRTLFLNPGYAGKPRFSLARTVAILHCDATGLRTEFKEL